MSSNSPTGGLAKMRFRRASAGAALIVVQAAVIGLAANAVSPHRLPWIRIPLKETHRIAASREVIPAPPPAVVRASPKAIPHRHIAAAPVERVPTSEESVAAQVATQDQALPESVKREAVKPKVGALSPKVAGQRAPGLATAPKKVEALFTTLADAKALFDHKSAVFLDARHAEDYDAEHVPGALSLFAEDLDSRYDAVLGGIPKSQPIVTYCSDPQCEMAAKLADALVARGHTRVFILLEGLPGWKSAGYPTKAGSAP